MRRSVETMPQVERVMQVHNLAARQRWLASLAASDWLSWM